MEQRRLRVNDDRATWTPTADGQIVILDLETSNYLSLNGPAATLWLQLSATSDEVAMVAALMNAYDDVTEQIARADVAEFIQDLDRRGLLLASS